MPAIEDDTAELNKVGEDRAYIHPIQPEGEAEENPEDKLKDSIKSSLTPSSVVVTYVNDVHLPQIGEMYVDGGSGARRA